MNIVVYCSSQEGLSNDYIEMAEAIGKWIGSNHHTLVFGGVKSGLMHNVAQATHDAGGRVVGVVPESFKERTHPVCDEVIYCNNLSDRKDLMILKGDIFICLPGGIGTIDEWISTLSQLIVFGNENKNPIFAINYCGMYDDLIKQLSSCTNSVFARGKDISCTKVVSDINDLINQLNKISKSL